MSDSARVFVFVCGWSEYLGLSLDKTGANSPAFISPPHKWTRIDDVGYSTDGLGTLNIDTNTRSKTSRRAAITSRCPRRKSSNFPRLKKRVTDARSH